MLTDLCSVVNNVTFGGGNLEVIVKESRIIPKTVPFEWTQTLFQTADRVELIIGFGGTNSLGCC